MDKTIHLPTHPRIEEKKRNTPTDTSPAAGAWKATVGIVVAGGFESQLHPVKPSVATLQIFVQYESRDAVKSLPTKFMNFSILKSQQRG